MWHQRNWHGCTKCCFCDRNETIDHLFISCPFARMFWRIAYMSFNIPPPSNITNLFGNWLNRVAKKDKAFELVCALWYGLFGMFKTILSLTKNFSVLHAEVIPLTTHWIHTWSFLQPEKARLAMDFGCNCLHMVAQNLYSQFRWHAIRRLTWRHLPASAF
jgi:hypothetical protein